MSVVPEHCRRALSAFWNTESLTLLMVTGSSSEHVAAVLRVDVDSPVADGWCDDRDRVAWAIEPVPGGVLAMEISGYGDPPTSALRALSDGGRSAAVVRSNIQAHVRFGCARDGEVLFDGDEYRYSIDEPEAVPEDLRPLLAVADDEGWFTVSFAMGQRFTRLEIAPEHITTLQASGFFAAPRAGFHSK